MKIITATLTLLLSVDPKVKAARIRSSARPPSSRTWRYRNDAAGALACARWCNDQKTMKMMTITFKLNQIKIYSGDIKRNICTGIHVTKIDAGQVEVCMGMGKTGIPWVPWDSHGNGSKISHGMRMGWEWELSAWEWELRRGSCHQQLWLVFCSYIVTWSKGSNAGGATAWDWASCAELK